MHHTPSLIQDFVIDQSSRVKYPCDLAITCYIQVVEWASYQMRKIVGCACTGNAGNVFPATDFKGNRKLAIPACITARACRTCREHVPWCMLGSLNPRLRGKLSWRSRCMRNPQFYVFGKRPMEEQDNIYFEQDIFVTSRIKMKYFGVIYTIGSLVSLQSFLYIS